MKIKFDKILGQIRESDEVQSYYYNIENGLRRWRSALAHVQSGSATIYNMNCFGDSITDGGGSESDPLADYANKGYVGVVRNKLNTVIGNVGAGAVNMLYPLYPAVDRWWGWDANWSSGSGGVAQRSINTAVNGAVATLDFSGTGLKLIYVTYPTYGSLSVVIDGGDPVVIDCGIGSDPNWAASTDITGLVDGAHTATITSVLAGGANNNVNIQGAVPLKGTAGIRVNNIGNWGTTSANGADYTTGASPKAANITLFAPILTTIAYLANDVIVNTTLAAYKANIQALITASKVYGDVLLIANGLRAETGLHTQIEYAKVLFDLAKINNCAFVDINTRWNNDAAYQKDVLGFGELHPNDAGHQDIGNAIWHALLENN